MFTRKYLVVIIVTLVSFFPCMGMRKLMEISADRKKAEAEKKREVENTVAYLSSKITFKNELLQQEVGDSKSAKVKLMLPGCAQADKQLSIILPFTLKEYSFSWFNRDRRTLLGVRLVDEQKRSLFSLEVIIDEETGTVILTKNEQGKTVLTTETRKAEEAREVLAAFQRSMGGKEGEEEPGDCESGFWYEKKS